MREKMKGSRGCAPWWVQGEARILLITGISPAFLFLMRLPCGVKGTAHGRADA